MSGRRILAVYQDSRMAANAVTAARAQEFGEIGVFTPVPDHAIEEALHGGSSPVRFFTLTGGVLGMIAGFALTIYTSLDWPLITGGKPIVSIPAFLIIVFELTILFAVIGSFLGFAISARFPQLAAQPLYDGRFTEDRYGVVVTCPEERSQAARAVLEGFNAEEIRTEVV